MSFNFEWPTFSEAFYADAREMLAQALNKGEKPPIIAGRIEVKELHMGTIPPELEILEIGDLSTDRFRGIFRLTYAGDAYIVLQTKVQANPLNVPRPSLDILGAPRILFAAAPLIVPMTLRLSSLSLRAIVVLVVSRQKGITLVFKNDPLESVNVSSSFDGVESVAGYIQKEIEGQLREAFRSDLPGVIHRLSQKWLSGEVKSATEGAPVGNGNGFEKDAKIETRTAYVPGGNDGDMRKASGKGRGLVTKMTSLSVGGDSVSIASDADTSFWTMPGDSRTQSLLGQSRRRSRVVAPSTQLRDDPLQSVPESIESYDPTYGLRPDAIPLHAGFAEYERLVRSGTATGFGDILGDAEADDLFDYGEPVGDGSFEVIGLRDLVEDGRGSSMPQWDSVGEEEDYRSRYAFDALGEPSVASGFETIPAVGGGTITRPRIFHTQSQMRTGTAASSGSLSNGSPSTTTARAMRQGSASSTVGPAPRPPSSLGMAPFAGMSIGGSGSSTPRFPFPAYGLGTASFASSSSLKRNDSLPNFQRNRVNLHRKSLSLSSSTFNSPQTTRRSSSSLFPSTLASSYSSPPSSTPSAPIEMEALPARRHPIDLLSRSPSSILSTSFEEDNSDLPITLNPTRNDSCAQLATLTHSNQTLSPFTRAHEHFTARSSPHIISRLGPGASRGGFAPAGIRASGTEPPVKAKRKRVHRIGAAKEAATAPGSPGKSVQECFSPETGRSSKAPSEMSDYFPSLGALGREGLMRAREGMGIAKEFWDADRY